MTKIIPHYTNYKWSNTSDLLKYISDAFKKYYDGPEKELILFWGLRGVNFQKIKKYKNWCMIDIGYLSNHMKTNPPDFNHVYWRLCKNSIHHNLKNVSTDDNRLKQIFKPGVTKLDSLVSYNILENYKSKEIDSSGHILLTPSSETMCKCVYGLSQNQWITKTYDMIRSKCNNEIKVRIKRSKKEFGKPPMTTIEEDLEGASCVVTGMSLTSLDGIINNIPVICDKRNIANSICSNDLDLLKENKKTVDKKQLYEWMSKVANCQFTIDEITDGTAFEYINER